MLAVAAVILAGSAAGAVTARRRTDATAIADAMLSVSLWAILPVVTFFNFARFEPDADGVFQKVTTFVKNRHSVHGLDFYDGWLYFSQASEGSVSRGRDTNDDGVADEVEYVLPPDSLPRPKATSVPRTSATIVERTPIRSFVIAVNPTTSR